MRLAADALDPATVRPAISPHPHRPSGNPLLRRSWYEHLRPERSPRDSTFYPRSLLDLARTATRPKKQSNPQKVFSTPDPRRYRTRHRLLDPPKLESVATHRLHIHPLC